MLWVSSAPDVTQYKFKQIYYIPPPRPAPPRAYLHVRWLWQVAAPGGPESPISSYTGGWWPPVSHGDCVQTCTVNTDTAINMLTHSYTAINMLLSWDHQFITEHFAALTFTSCNMLTLLTRTIYTCIYQQINCNRRRKFVTFYVKSRHMKMKK